MNGQVEVFNFSQEKTPIRVQLINSEPWFVAKDVCEVLGHSNHKMAVKTLDEDEKGVSSVYSLGGNQQTTVVSESGLYSLIFQSRKPEAKKFRKWVTAEVLPSVRKTGRYEVKPKVKSRPRLRSVEMASFHDELTQWVTKADVAAVADLMNVTPHHVHEVLRGRCQSYGVLCMLVECGKDNRKRGVRRVLRYRRRAEDMEQLRLEFMNDLPVED